jgi:hypothetical protein
MHRTLARLNIEHFKKLLSQETGKAKQGTLQRLIAEEEVKLKVLEAEARAKKHH